MMSSTSTKEPFTIHTSLLFSPHLKSFISNISLLVSPATGLIVRIYTRPNSSIPSPLPPNDIDLTHLVVLPGLVDAHTHIFLHPYAETPALHQILHESLVERTLRAANHARAALAAGYTTYRDLGTEGLGAADVNLRDAINRGITAGPRLFVATDPLASSGGYVLHIENANATAPRLADEANGVDGVRAAVRRRLAAGADVLKFYADQEKRNARFPEAEAWPGALGVRHGPDWGDKPKHYLLFSEAEMRAIVDEAHEAECPVAAHASSPAAVIRAARAGVDTVEHGQEPSAEALAIMKEMGTIFVPTLTVMEEEVPEEVIGSMYQHTCDAWKAGVKLACGGDIGPVAHGENVRELELMIAAGIPVEEVLTAATLHGWEACGGAWCGRKFGWLDEGCAADLVGLKGDPREDVKALRSVEFVMKDGMVYKMNGNMIEYN
jgi:imidazolonepropionase-like amidohydrolase